MTTLIGGTPSQPSGSGLIVDTSTQGFRKDVLEASLKVPIMVDFWAPWSAQCKQLTPILEKIVQSYKGKIRLAKLNIDQDKALAQQLHIQSVPAVYVFFQGRPVDGFAGVVPESQIREFIKKLLGMMGVEVESPLEAIVAQTKALMNDGDYRTASGLLQQILQQDSGQITAKALLARCYVELGKGEEATKLLHDLPEKDQFLPEVIAVKAALSLTALSEEWLKRAGEKVSGPDEIFIRALKAYGVRDYAAMIPLLLTIVKEHRAWNDDLGRKTLVHVFEVLGPDHPLISGGRRQLASLLFS